MSADELCRKGTVVSFSFDMYGVRRTVDYMLVSTTEDDEYLFQLACIEGYYHGKMSGYVRKDNAEETGNQQAVTRDHLINEIVRNFGESVQVTRIQGPPLPKKLPRRLWRSTELCFHGTRISLICAKPGVDQVYQFLLVCWYGDREHHFQLVCTAGPWAGDVKGLIRKDDHKKVGNASAVTRGHLVKELVRNLDPSVRAIRTQESYPVRWRLLLRWFGR